VCIEAHANAFLPKSLGVLTAHLVYWSHLVLFCFGLWLLSQQGSECDIAPTAVVCEQLS